MELYPLDYQISLARIIRERLAAPPTSRTLRDHAGLEDALERLYRSDFGQCVGCGSVIPFLHLSANPAARHCAACKAH